MSRLALFIKNVASGYALLGSNILYSLLSVPLALAFLPKPEFALWALLAQLMAYLLLVDLGMSPAVGRLLVDFKDDPASGRYGALIQTSFLVGAAQGLILLVVGWTLAPLFARLFLLPPEFAPDFVRMVRWQSVFMAINFLVRSFRHLLYAHQRNDIVNYLQAGGLFLSFVTLWTALSLGAGVYSVVWANATAIVGSNLGAFIGCRRLRFLPPRGCWGRPTGPLFRQLFGFGGDVFLIHVGSLLIMATQPMLISRFRDLDEVAAWSVGIKVFNLLHLMICTIYMNSSAAFSEMIVRQETARLRARYLAMLRISLAAAVAAAVISTACNRLFIDVWTAGRIPWNSHYDLLLGVWMVILVMVHANSGLVTLTKQIRFLRYIYFIEGLVFLLGATLLLPPAGIAGMLALSVLCSGLFTGAYGLVRVRRHLAVQWTEVRRQLLPGLGRVAAILVPVAAAVCWLTQSLATWPSLLIRAGVLGPLGGLFLLRFGLAPELQRELLARVAGRWRPLLASVLGRTAHEPPAPGQSAGGAAG